MLLINLTRLLVFLICSASLVVMGFGFYFHHSCWNTKTRDYWYGRMMWSVVGISATTEGFLRHTPFRYTLVFIVAAALSTFKGNITKGPWGNNSDDDCQPDRLQDERLDG